MFFIIFGSVWLLITGMITYGFYGLGSEVSVNGVLMEAEEFAELLWPKLFLAVFWIIGIVVLGIGIKKVVANIQTSTRGHETYGIITDVRYNGTSVNGQRMLDAVVAILTEEQMTETYSESIGFNGKGYYPGEFVKVKHYKNDINILNRVSNSDVPYHYAEMLQDCCPQDRYGIEKEDLFNDEDFIKDDSDTIVINGKTYKRVD